MRNSNTSLQPQFDFGPVEHCRTFHAQHQSGVAFTQLHLDGEWDVLGGVLNFDQAMHFAWGVMPEELNLYMTVNAIRPFGRRNIENVTHLNCYFVDLDFYNLGLSFDSVLDEVAVICQEHKLPYPSHVVDSGRGAYLIWRFTKSVYCGVKDEGRKRLDYWYNCQGTLIDLFRGVGADSRCKDASRVLRLAGTVNSKVERPVTFYTWGKKAIAFNAVTTAITRFYKSQRQEQSDRYQRESGASIKVVKRQSSAVVHMHTTRTLMLARMEDLKVLASLRGGRLTDNREMAIFYYAISASVFYASKDGLLESVAEFIESSIKQGGKYDSDRPEKLLTSVINKHLDKDKVRESGGDYSQIQYRARNGTIIRNLGITALEQESLKTIISTEEKQRRNTVAHRKVRRELGVIERSEYEKNSLSRTKPWVALGYSRAKWYRLGKPEK